jgi:hypothetical protein
MSLGQPRLDSEQFSFAYAACIDINARMQTQALLLSKDIVTLRQSELFTPEEFDINRPWEHFKQKTLNQAAKAKVVARSSGSIRGRRRNSAGQQCRPGPVSGRPGQQPAAALPR